MEKIFFPSKSSFAVFVWIVIVLEIFINFGTINRFAHAVKTTGDQQILRLFHFTTDYPHLREAVETIVSQKAPVVKKIPTDDLQCMAENIYYEASNQSYAGKIAVGQVVLNRVKAPGFPQTVCGVIWEGSQNIRTTACQFSWTCAPREKVNTSSTGWAQSMKAAKELLTKKDAVIDITEGALNYHADYVNPSWSKRLLFVAKIDQHLFYKKPQQSDTIRNIQ